MVNSLRANMKPKMTSATIATWRVASRAASTHVS